MRLRPSVPMCSQVVDIVRSCGRRVPLPTPGDARALQLLYRSASEAAQRRVARRSGGGVSEVREPYYVHGAGHNNLVEADPASYMRVLHDFINSLS